MRSETIGLARLAVRQQVEIFGGDQVSLNSLWRAVGSPAGQDPERWAEVAAPLAFRFLGLSRPAREHRRLAGRRIAAVVDLGGRIQGPVAHRRLDEP